MEANPLLNIKNYESHEQFIGEIQKIQYVSNPLNELVTSSSAIVYSWTPCCNARCLIPCSCIFNCNCGDNFKYSILISNNLEQKYLFNNLGRLDCKLCSCDRMSRYAYCKSFNISSYDQFSSNAGTESVEMVKENNCVVCGLCSTFFDVKIKPENRLAGVVKYKGPCEVCCKCVCDCDCNCDCCGCGCSICCGICEICKVCSNCKDICYNYFYCLIFYQILGN